MPTVLAAPEKTRPLHSPTSRHAGRHACVLPDASHSAGIYGCSTGGNTPGTGRLPASRSTTSKIAGRFVAPSASSRGARGAHRPFVHATRRSPPLRPHRRAGGACHLHRGVRTHVHKSRTKSITKGQAAICVNTSMVRGHASCT